MAELKTDAKGKGNKVKPGCVEAHAGTWTPKMRITNIWTCCYSDLTLVYPDMAELKLLLTGLTLPRQNQTETAIDSEALEPCGQGNIRQQSSGLTFSQIQPFIKRMSPSASTEGEYQCINISFLCCRVQRSTCSHCWTKGLGWVNMLATAILIWFVCFLDVLGFYGPLSLCVCVWVRVCLAVVIM
jgi:hypothetical protein